MEKKAAIELVNNKIRGYKLQRDNTVYTDMCLNPLVETFRINSSNIVMFPEPVILIGSTIALITGTIFFQELMTHPLTKQIKKLKELKSTIQHSNYCEDITTDELDEFTQVKTYSHK